MLKNVFNHSIFNSKKNVNVLGINKSVQAVYAWNLFCEIKKSLLIVTNTLYEANNLYKSLTFYDNKNVLLFPMDDFLVSEVVAISPDLMSMRIETLNKLSIENKPRIIITNLMGFLRFLPAKTLWKKLNIDLKINDVLNRDELVQKLNIMGYKKENIVTKTGEYANRGYILDIFPYGQDNPIRIEFFDDLIEEIRIFDSNTQLSLGKIKNIIIYPFTEFINEKGLDLPLRQSLLPMVTKNVSSILNYVCENETMFIDIDQIKLSFKNIMKEVTEFKSTDVYNVDKYMFDLCDLIPQKYINLLSVDNLIKENIVESYHTEEITCFNGNYESINYFITKMISEGKRVIVCLSDKSIIEDFISKVKIKSIITNQDELKDSYVNIVDLKLPNGFIINKNVYLTTNELYKSNYVIKHKSSFKYGTKINDINTLKIGDYVVHATNGIGKYLGIVTLKSKNIEKDYIYLQYKDGDKLYIPVEKIELISKYSSHEGIIPRLNKLGSTEWIKQKAKVRGKVKDIAQKLLDMSVKRKMATGFAFCADDKEQYLFEAAFPYEETKDQLKAIKEIKEDMEKNTPMDRLLCGDVGYGKTEVAFRAIFKAIKSGKQVAFLCPTTILSKQHYENALDRFSGFGVNIEVLNRFVSDKHKQEIIENLKNGKIDLIIGTHRLLSKDIIYKDLGLLVIDEEQRFGVVHKEKIKEYKNIVDILTLSATPIPRTLQMSLTGIRGLSLIETPPAFRNPIQTYVLRENEQVIKDAIYKELSRDGQVFLLYNNVSRIVEQVSRIEKLVPEAKITYVHGQMNRVDIERSMEQFVLGEYNVLICTTIIETGIDIQNANTLIVLDADHFGLSQLYQIRGRIGRGKNIGYAYLMYNKEKELNEIAVKRLNAIKEFTELGSGYALAIRDLSIRGAGDILGSLQSGFIDSIGYSMYIKILNEEVEKLKCGNKNSLDNSQETKVDEKPLVQVSTHISDKYADSEEIKIEIHKKINTIDSYEKFKIVKKELEDRFGTLDEEIIIYMLEELFETLAKQKHVYKVVQSDSDIVLYFDEEVSSHVNGAVLLTKLFNISQNFKVEYVNKVLKISLTTKNLDKHFIYYLVEMIDIIE